MITTRTIEEVVEAIRGTMLSGGMIEGKVAIGTIFNTELDEILEIHKAEQTRPKGKWIEGPNCSYRCSNCGEHYFSVQDYIRYKFCPNCGSYNGGNDK